MSNDERVSMRGPVVVVPGATAGPLALCLNELVTNAIKHGALRSAAGSLAIEWSAETDGTVRLDWQEASALAAAAPGNAGLGLDLIRGFLKHELRGSVDDVFNDSGFSAHLAFDPAAGHGEDAPAPPPRADPPGTRPIA